MTASTAIQASLTIPGLPEQVRAARAFVGRTLGSDHPCAFIAVLLVSELVTNSVQHSSSRGPDGIITITVTGIADGVQVEVADAGGMSVPAVRRAGGDMDEAGRGLCLVNDLSTEWGYHRGQAGLVTWFVVKAEPSAGRVPRAARPAP